MQAEPGAVTSRPGSQPGADWRGGRSVGFREEAALPGRHAARAGRKGGHNTPPGSGTREAPQSGPEERPDANTTPQWSAGRRAPYVTGRARLARRAVESVTPVGVPLPPPVWEKGKREGGPAGSP